MANFFCPNRQRWFLSFLILTFSLSTLTGCASFRKKFVRKKKVQDKQEDFIPVLEPVDYPVAEKKPGAVYQEQYIVVKAYFKDMWDALGVPKVSDKQQIYIFKQLAVHLEMMAEQLKEDKKSELLKVVEQIKEVAKNYDKAGAMRRYDIMKSDMRFFENEIRRGFRPDMIKDNLLD